MERIKNTLISLDIETRAPDGHPDKDLALDHNRNVITKIALYSPSDYAIFDRVEDMTSLDEYEIVTHGGKFDFKTLIAKGAPLTPDMLVHDTLSMAVTFPHKIPESWLLEYEEGRKQINEALGKNIHRNAGKHSLKTLAPYFLGVEPYWETEDHANDEYVLKDAKYTYELAQFFMREFTDEQYEFYLKLQNWTRMLLRAEVKGAYLDFDKLAYHEPIAEKKEKEARALLEEEWAEHFEKYKEVQITEVSEAYKAKSVAALARLKNPTEEKREKSIKRYHDLFIKAVEKVKPFNLASPDQLKWLFKERMGVDIKTFSGDEESTGKAVLERLAGEGVPGVQTFLSWRKANKLITSFFPTYRESAYKGRIFSNYNTMGTRTGRLSCIAEGELVQVPGGQVPIEKIKEGDYVYCYDNENKLTLRKVTAVLDQGIKECVEVKWQSSGTGQIGRLICTPDHKIKTKLYGWRRADDLPKRAKLLHMSRSELTSGRSRIYSHNRVQELEEALIKREFFGAPSHLHIHHIDENKANNSLDNLAVCTQRGHNKLHDQLEGKISGKAVKKQKVWTKFALYRELVKARGRPTLVDANFTSFKRYCAIYGIALMSVSQRYSAKGKYLSKGNVLKALTKGNVDVAAKWLGVGTRKLRKLCWDYKIPYNHMVLSVKPIGLRKTYDLQVEELENFIASEICVHNCSNPNLQQISKDILDIFGAPQGRKLVYRDVSAIEPRLIAYETECPNLCKIFLDGSDFHSFNVRSALGIEEDDKTIKEKYKNERDLMKEVGLALMYGAGWRRIQECAAKRGFPWTEKYCKQLYRNFARTYERVWEFKEALEVAIKDGEVVTNVLGRPLHYDLERLHMQSLNTKIQSGGSDLLLDSVAKAEEKAKSLGIVFEPVLFIHDAVAVETLDNEAQRVYDLVGEAISSWDFQTVWGRIPLLSEGGIFQNLPAKG